MCQRCHSNDGTPIRPTRFDSKKTGKAGYAPACSNKFVPGVCALPSTVPLLSIVRHAYPAIDSGAVHVDLFGSDNFHPADRPTCADPLRAAEIATARVEVTSHDVSYENAPSLAGCPVIPPKNPPSMNR